MGTFSRIWVIGYAALGFLTLSQAPEFAQQYKQRIGGGITELASVVNQFERDAVNQGLTRQQALEVLAKSGEAFPKSRGRSMERVITRYENLLRQRNALENSSTIMQPVHLIRYPDRQTMSGTLSVFKPGVQLTLSGIMWGLVGGGLGAGLAKLPISVSRQISKRKRVPKVTPDPFKS
ncbi:MAG: DUF2937 family protein [Rhizobiaceae bacterium]